MKARKRDFEHWTGVFLSLWRLLTREAEAIVFVYCQLLMAPPGEGGSWSFWTVEFKGVMSPDSSITLKIQIIITIIFYQRKFKNNRSPVLLTVVILTSALKLLKR